METTRAKKRYIVVGDGFNCHAILWPAGEPFELYIHKVKGKRYTVEYASDAHSAKTLRLISELEDMIEEEKNDKRK
jgi:hypothetical protein